MIKKEKDTRVRIKRSFEEIFTQWENKNGHIQIQEHKENEIKREAKAIRKATADLNIKKVKEIDLHGQTCEQAKETLERKIPHLYKQGYNIIEIIHGRGLHSIGEPILKDCVREKLKDFVDYIKKISYAKPSNGGNGKTILLFKSRKNN